MHRGSVIKALLKGACFPASTRKLDRCLCLQGVSCGYDALHQCSAADLAGLLRCVWGGVQPHETSESIGNTFMCYTNSAQLPITVPLWAFHQGVIELLKHNMRGCKLSRLLPCDCWSINTSQYAPCNIYMGRSTAPHRALASNLTTFGACIAS
jgi:hypothetical protein